MSEKYERAEELIRDVAPDWQWQDYAKIRQGVQRRQRRSLSMRFAALTVALASASAALTTVFVLGLPSKDGKDDPTRVSQVVQALPPVNAPVAAAPSMKMVDPAKGLEIRAMRADTVVRPLPSATNTTYELTQGEATFAVTEPLPKPLAIQVRDLVVKDIGTTFSVAMQPNKTVVVSVSQGLVQVTGPNTDVFIKAGHMRRFPWGQAEQAGLTKNAQGGARPKEQPVKPLVATTQTEPTLPRWVELAESKNYQEAYVRLAAEAPAEESLSASELLLAADAARLSHHEQQALPFLDNFLGRFPQDDSVPLVRFTKGKVLMSLGQHLQAAQAFEEIQTGVLAQEAFVRAIEARVRAGDRTSAEALARQYERRFPSGTFHGRISSLLR